MVWIWRAVGYMSAAFFLYIDFYGTWESQAERTATFMGGAIIITICHVHDSIIKAIKENNNDRKL